MIRTLLYKDLLRRWRNPGGMIVLVLIPLLAALMLGSIFGTGNTSAVRPRVHLLVEDYDDGFASQMLLGAFSRGELAQMFQLEKVATGSGRKRMDQGDASALLVIPAGFGDSLLAGTPVALGLIKNPSQSFAPKIAEETVQILGEAGDRLLHIAADPLARIREGSQGHAQLTEKEVADVSVAISRLFKQGEKYLLPPRLKVARSTLDTEGKKANSDHSLLFGYMLSGMGIMALLFMLDTVAKDTFRERETRTLYRMLVSPAGAAEYTAAKLLFMFAAGLLSQLVMWMFATVLFSLQIAHPLLFVSVLVAATAALTGIIGLVYGLVRTRTQASAILPVVIIIFSMLGGAMLPFNMLPESLQSAGKFSPVFWCIDGLQQVLAAGANQVDLSAHFYILVTLSLVLNGLAFLSFVRKVRT